MKLIEELKRRNVFRVGAAYVLLGWVVIQVTDTVSPALNLPDWTLGLITWLGIIGLPFAVFFAWAFELTPDGIRREVDASGSEPTNAATAQKLDVALVVLLVIVIGLIGWNSIGEDTDVESQVAGPASADNSGSVAEPLSIAVLPLLNMSADSNNAYFAGGVHEEILTNLSRIDGLRVVSRTTALRYMNSDLSLRDIGLDLGVRYIVEGSVRRVNNHVRVTVQLIDAVSDTHIWASNYDRELVDVFAVQSEVAKLITNSLHLEIQPETVGTLDDMPTRSVKAYDLYTKAFSVARSKAESEAALAEQRDLLEAAVVADPDFVEAWAALNEIYDHISRNILQNNWFGDSQVERDASFTRAQERAQLALEKAVTLDADNVMSLLAQASDYVREQEGRDFQLNRKIFIDRALERAPDNAQAWLVLAWWYRIEGNMDEATPAFDRALELDPLNAQIVGSSLTHFRFIGDQDMTSMLFERLTQIAPEKADNKSLGQVAPLARLWNLIALFGQTVDESVIDAYAEELDGSVQHELERNGTLTLTNQFGLDRFTSWLHQMRGDLDSLLASHQLTLPDDANEQQIFYYLWYEVRKILANQVAGKEAEVRLAANRMMAAYELLQDATSSVAEAVDLPMSVAHLVLGNDEEVSQVREKLANSDDDFLLSRMDGSFLIYSILDADAAVERMLQRKAEYPSWYGPDRIATLQGSFRHSLMHPKMQAYYLQEGKWIDYLAARVPEYAQYRR